MVRTHISYPVPKQKKSFHDDGKPLFQDNVHFRKLARVSTVPVDDRKKFYCVSQIVSAFYGGRCSRFAVGAIRSGIKIWGNDRPNWCRCLRVGSR